MASSSRSVNVCQRLWIELLVSTINDDIMMITSCKKKMRATCHQQKELMDPQMSNHPLWKNVKRRAHLILSNWYYIYTIWCYIMLCIASRLYYIYIYISLCIYIYVLYIIDRYRYIWRGLVAQVETLQLQHHSARAAQHVSPWGIYTDLGPQNWGNSYSESGVVSAEKQHFRDHKKKSRMQKFGAHSTPLSSY